jgi:hypothetical protein
MAIQATTVLGQNITLVYKVLDPHSVDTGDLKNIMGTDIRPMLMDTPEMIVAVFPPQPVVIEIGNRRIRITLARPDRIGSVPIWEIACKCHQLVPNANDQILAFGFNYDIGATLPDVDTKRLVLDMFIPEVTQLEGKLQGSLIAFIPRLIFRRDQLQYDLVLEAISDNRFKVHMNVHHETPATALPDQERLKASFHEQYEYMLSMLPKLLG